MKTYLSDVVPKLKRYSKKLDDISVLKNVHWKLVDEEDGSRVVYIFRDGNQLLISKDGAVEKGRWEYLGNNSLLIDIDDNSFLFKKGFYNEYALGLKKDGTNEYAILIDEDKLENEIKSLKDLEVLTSLLEGENQKPESNIQTESWNDKGEHTQDKDFKNDTSEQFEIGETVEEREENDNFYLTNEDFGKVYDESPSDRKVADYIAYIIFAFVILTILFALFDALY